MITPCTQPFVLTKELPSRSFLSESEAVTDMSGLFWSFASSSIAVSIAIVAWHTQMWVSALLTRSVIASSTDDCSLAHHNLMKSIAHIFQSSTLGQIGASPVTVCLIQSCRMEQLCRSPLDFCTYALHLPLHCFHKYVLCGSTFSTSSNNKWCNVMHHHKVMITDRCLNPSFASTTGFVPSTITITPRSVFGLWTAMMDLNATFRIFVWPSKPWSSSPVTLIWHSWFSCRHTDACKRCFCCVGGTPVPLP